MIKIFISYSHKDRGIVEDIVEKVKSLEFDVWIDQNEMIAGESIRESIEAAIDETDVFLVALSPNSISSRWVHEELNMMLERATRGKSVIMPVLLEKCDIPPFLRGRKWIDFSQNYEKSMDELQKTLTKWASRKKDKFIRMMMENLSKEQGKPKREVSLAYSAIANTAMGIGNYHEAVDILEQSIDIWYGNWDAHHLLAGSLIKLGKYDEADNILVMLLNRRIQKGRAYYNLACLKSLKAEILGKTNRQEHDLLISQCFDYLSKSFSSGFIPWLTRYGFQTDPVSDITQDSDLFYARTISQKIERLIVSLQRKYKRSKKKRQVSQGGGCSACDTNITLYDGSKKPIKDIHCGDLLLSQTPGGGKAISRVWRKLRLWENEGVTINNKVTVSATQPILSSQGWKLAKSLTTKDIILGPKRKLIDVISIEKWEGQKELYHVGIEGFPYFIAEDMIFHNTKK